MSEKLVALEAFIREEPYNRLLQLGDKIDTHPWSRRQIQRDADFVGLIWREVQAVANELYRVRQELLFSSRSSDDAD